MNWFRGQKVTFAAVLIAGALLHACKEKEDLPFKEDVKIAIAKMEKQSATFMHKFERIPDAAHLSPSQLEDAYKEIDAILFELKYDLPKEVKSIALDLVKEFQNERAHVIRRNLNQLIKIKTVNPNTKRIESKEGSRLINELEMEYQVMLKYPNIVTKDMKQYMNQYLDHRDRNIAIAEGKYNFSDPKLRQMK